MSKFARVYHLGKEIQKIYKGGILKKLFFDWKHYIGEEINIEYARGYCSNRISINGKVYQNLASKLYIGTGNALVPTEIKTLEPNGYTHIKLPYTLKPNTAYSIIVNIIQPSEEHAFQLRNAKMEYLTLTIPSLTSKLVKGKNIAMFTTSSDEISVILIKNNTNCTKDLIIKNDIILIEGDLSGETITEENIKYLEEGTFKPENMIIEGKTYQNLCIEDTSNEMSILNFSNYNMFKINTYYTIIFEITVDNASQVNFAYNNSSHVLVAPKGNSKGIYKFKVRNINTSLGVLTSVKLLSLKQEGYTTCLFKNVIVLEGDYTNIDLPNSIDGIESVGEREFVNTPTEYYPVTIRNYNYKCKTDGIVLPNGTKNSIDTIDGKKVHVQRVWKRVFDGSDDEKWRNGYGNGDGKNNRFELEINSKGSYSNTYMDLNIVASVCSHFEYEITNSIPKSFGHYRIVFNNSMGKIYLLFNIDTNIVPLEDISAWKTWLSENPVTVWYELATPIYTYLESGIYDEIIIPTPSNIRNEIYSENGKWYHKRNIGKVIFDGSSDENWHYYNKEGIQRFDVKMSNDAKMYSKRKPVYAVGYQFDASKNEDKTIFISGVEKVNKLYIYNHAYTSVKDFRAYLAKNPLEVYYELAEPVISELHFSDITYKLNEPLRSLPNGVCDTIEENKLVQRVGKVVFDGSNDEKWIYHTSLSNDVVSLFYLGFHSVSSERLLGISDRLPCYTIADRVSNISKGIECFYLGDGTSSLIQLQILNSKLNSLDKNGVLAYLQANHITIYYPLATPIETEITPDKILINGEVITDTADIKLPNGTKDIIEEGYYIKRVGKVTYNGQEDWKTAQANTNVLVFYLNNTNFKELSSLICDTYTVGATSKDKTITCGNVWRPQIRDDSCSTVEEFKQLLAKNPITVWYELATPDKIPLFLIKEGLTTLKSMNNITPQIELDCLVRDKFQNMCPNTWVNGDISVASGVEYSSSASRIKLQDYIAVQPNTTYYCDTFSETVYSGTGKIGARYYKKDKTYISGGGIGIAKTSYNKFTTPKDCYYIKFIVETLDTNYKMYLRPVK